MEYVFDEITVACSNTDRIVFPDSGITKGDVIAYYRDVAGLMLPELRGRPLTLERFTKGLAGGGYFQKHWQKHFPSWLDHVELGGKTRVDYPICDTAAGLVYFANQGAIAFHAGRAARPRPITPTRWCSISIRPTVASISCGARRPSSATCSPSSACRRS